MKKIQVIFLGTNGWFDTDTGNTICTLLNCPDYYIILDAGYGLHKVDKYIKEKKPVYMLLSHFHLDHIIGLHVLPKFTRIDHMVIGGQTGTKKILKSFISSPFTKPLEKQLYNISLLEFPRDTKKLPFHLKTLPLVHADSTIGYRITIGDKIVTYCTDTGYCENAVILAKESDLLITECANKPGDDFVKWPHLNPEKAARIATEAGAKKLLLTHFDARNYTSLKHRDRAQKVAARCFKNSFAAHDGLKVLV